MTNCKYKLRKLSIGLVSVGTMFMASPVMGEDISQPTTSVTTESSAIQTEENQGRQAGALTGPPAVAVAEPAPASQTSSSAVIAMPVEAPAKAAEVAETPAQEQARPRNRRSATEVAPQTMEVEKIQVDKEKSEVTVSDGTGKEKLIKNRDDEQRKLFDVSREVVADADGKTLNVTLTVKPKQIDKGAEVIVLLDVSKKMSKENIDTAKENIKKLVQTLTVSSSDGIPTQKARVRLITFYNKVSEPIELTVDKDDTKMEEVDTAIAKVWVEAKEARNWGVDLQGAIHKARKLFNSSQEKGSGKRQHIVLFSQGESTFSYALKKGEKEKLQKVAVNEPVTYSNPLLFWPFYFDTTTETHNVVKDAEKLIALLNKVGITQFDDVLKGMATTGNETLSLINNFFGIKNPLDYIILADLDTKSLSEKQFDYEKRLGEGYNFRSYADRVAKEVGLKKILSDKIDEHLKKLQPTEAKGWLDYFGLSTLSDRARKWAIDQALDKLFYHRQYQFYNHNLSAQAEAKMAEEEGIIFRSFDVTMPDAPKRYISSTEKSEAEKRNEKFDKYLKEMSEGEDFFKDVENAEKFKDILTEVKVTETFTDKVTVEKGSWKDSSNKGEIQYQEAKAGNTGWLSSFLSSSTPESLTWTISKESLQNALQSGTPLTLRYKLNVKKDKFKLPSPTGTRGSVETLESSKATEKAISSGKVTYKINGQNGKETKLADMNVTYSKEIVRKPQVEPKVPEAPKEIPLTPLQPSIPETPMPEDPTEREPEIIGNGEIIDLTEDTQSGMSGQNPGSVEETVVEDTQTIQEDIVLGGQGQVIDFTEDSQPGMTGDNSHTEESLVTEDSKPSQGDEMIIGGQDQVIDFTEDTQSGMSGAGQVENPTITEETHKPEIIMGGQSDPIDMVEDTLPGMSGSNEATVVEEDTRPKLQFHFDNEEPVPATVPTVSQAPITQVESKVPHAKAESALPQTGDTNKLETFFTITALTVIGAAGLLGKKRRDNQTD